MSKPIRGVALAPGVSRNGRLYTPENITNAFNRLSARIADPSGRPVVMRTHHAAGDDSTRIVAQISKVALTPDYRITYEATPVDTAEANTIVALATPQANGKPPLAHVSIFGWWLSDPVKQQHDGQLVETADDLEIDFIDFTASPGVAAATASTETRTRPNAISESHDVEINVTETYAATIDTTPTVFADPGYLPDNTKRYPIDTAESVRKAWASINEKTDGYTAAQSKRIRTRIKTAAKKTGVKIQDNWLYSGSELTGDAVGEYYADVYGIDIDPGNPPATFCFDATNGPIRVSISSYNIDPADLEVVTKAAIQAANDALKALDPDMDGDIDVPGADAEDTDEDATETVAPNTSADVAENAATVAETPIEKEPSVAETQNDTAPVTETAPTAAPALDAKALAEAVIAIMDARDAAKAAAVTEETTEQTEPVTETATADQAQLREGLKDVVRELLAEGGVKATRKGFALAEQTEAETTSQELWENRGNIIGAVAHENR